MLIKVLATPLLKEGGKKALRCSLLTRGGHSLQSVLGQALGPHPQVHGPHSRDGQTYQWTAVGLREARQRRLP